MPAKIQVRANRRSRSVWKTSASTYSRASVSAPRPSVRAGSARSMDARRRIEERMNERSVSHVGSVVAGPGYLAPVANVNMRPERDPGSEHAVAADPAPAPGKGRRPDPARAADARAGLDHRVGADDRVGADLG